MSGSWTLDRAIKARWNEKGLDAKFRAYWSSPAETRFSPWNDSEDVRPNTPMPYVSFEKILPIKTGESSGSESEGSKLIEYWTVPIQFTIHAANTGKKSGKEICTLLAKEIVAAYEDAAGALSMDDDDCHVQTVVGGDFGRREDDDVWQWAVLFEVQIERRRSLRGV